MRERSDFNKGVNPSKRGKCKTKEKCERMDTLVDVDTDSETESSVARIRTWNLLKACLGIDCNTVRLYQKR